MIAEEKLNQLNTDLIKASENKNGPEIGKLSTQIHTTQTLIDSLYGDLEKLYDEKQLKESQFEELAE